LIDAAGRKILVRKNFHAAERPPDLGAFEVFCNGCLVYSKIGSYCFPNSERLSDKVLAFAEDFQAGKDLGGYQVTAEGLQEI